MISKAPTTLLDFFSGKFRNRYFRGNSTNVHRTYRNAISRFWMHLDREPTVNDLSHEVYEVFRTWLADCGMFARETRISTLQRIRTLYRPSRHKGQHFGKVREIFIGPRAQAILAPYLKRQRYAYCFSPRESVKRWQQEKRARRKSKVQPSQVDRSKPIPKYSPAEYYGSRSYNRAIQRACVRAWVPKWAPNQLRHAAATEFRQQFGLEAAQVLLGHSRADVTQVYAERNTGLATEVIRKIG